VPSGSVSVWVKGRGWHPNLVRLNAFYTTRLHWKRGFLFGAAGIWTIYGAVASHLSAKAEFRPNGTLYVLFNNSKTCDGKAIAACVGQAKQVHQHCATTGEQ